MNNTKNQKNSRQNNRDEDGEPPMKKNQCPFRQNQGGHTLGRSGQEEERRRGQVGRRGQAEEENRQEEENTA